MCVTGCCCLRDLGGLNDHVFSRVSAALSPSGDSKTMPFRKCVLPQRHQGAQKALCLKVVAASAPSGAGGGEGGGAWGFRHRDSSPGRSGEGRVS